MRKLTNAALTTLASQTIGASTISDLESVLDAIQRTSKGNAAQDYKNDTGETTVTNILSGLNGLNP